MEILDKGQEVLNNCDLLIKNILNDDTVPVMLTLEEFKKDFLQLYNACNIPASIYVTLKCVYKGKSANTEEVRYVTKKMKNVLRNGIKILEDTIYFELYLMPFLKVKKMELKGEKFKILKIFTKEPIKKGNQYYVENGANKFKMEEDDFCFPIKKIEKAGFISISKTMDNDD